MTDRVSPRSDEEPTIGSELVSTTDVRQAKGKLAVCGKRGPAIIGTGTYTKPFRCSLERRGKVASFL